jgi:DNA uptake protein ComE-like DNA-binding protein
MIKLMRGRIITFSLVIALAAMWCIAPSIATEKPANASVPQGLVDLNGATIDQLEALPGIDARLASIIVKGRPYSKINELVALGIVKQSEFNTIKPLITVGVGGSKPATPLAAKAPAVMVDLNTATKDKLDALPGVGASDAAAILAARPYASIDDLITKKVISQAVFDKIRGAVTVSPAEAPAADDKKVGSDQGLVPAKPVTSQAIVVDLNTATVDDMIKWLGIGPTRAKKIIAGRPYATAEEVVTKGFLPQSTFDAKKSYIVVSPANR